MVSLMNNDKLIAFQVHYDFGKVYLWCMEKIYIKKKESLDSSKDGINDETKIQRNKITYKQ